MKNTYECMLLLDNREVRRGWDPLKQEIARKLKKYGAEIVSSRRWDERKLTYPIRQRRRATYLLAYCELGGDGVANLRRELDINEILLRYLLLRAESVPAQEYELTQAEAAAGFQVPEPPPDDARIEEEEAEVEAVEDADAEEPVGVGQESEES